MEHAEGLKEKGKPGGWKESEKLLPVLLIAIGAITSQGPWDCSLSEVLKLSLQG